LELSSKLEIIYSKRNRKFGFVRKQVGPNEYIFYSILNTDIAMELGVAASVVRIKIVIKIFSPVIECK